jgi:small-conductance mechanosensitive channel
MQELNINVAIIIVASILIALLVIPTLIGKLYVMSGDVDKAYMHSKEKLLSRLVFYFMTGIVFTISMFMLILAIVLFLLLLYRLTI